jgi:hypothetical protein
MNPKKHFRSHSESSIIEKKTLDHTRFRSSSFNEFTVIMDDTGQSRRKSSIHGGSDIKDTVCS